MDQSEIMHRRACPRCGQGLKVLILQNVWLTVRSGNISLASPLSSENLNNCPTKCPKCDYGTDSVKFEDWDTTDISHPFHLQHATLAEAIETGLRLVNAQGTDLDSRRSREMLGNILNRVKNFYGGKIQESQ